MAGRTEHLKPDEVDLLGLEHKEHDNYSLGKEKRRKLYAYRGHSPAVIEAAIEQNISPMKVILPEDIGYGGGESERVDGSIANTPMSLPSAWEPSLNRFLTLKEFCTKYGLDPKIAKSGRLITHNAGHITYNIAFQTQDMINTFNYIEAMEQAMESIKPPKKPKHKKGRQGIDVLTDLHFGAYVLATNKTPEFSPTILTKQLNTAANDINRMGYGTVHVHLLGDLIESFTGLNHKNVWKNLAHGHYGAKVIKMFVEMFKKHYLDLIPNLGSIKIVAGNHDRVTSGKDEDTDGDASYLIAYCLELLGYDVEFSPSVLTHEVEGINHILNHGHNLLTKKLSTQEICWQYGEKGKFNFVQEGHLHSRIAKLNATQIKNFKMIDGDNIDCRRQVMASCFTGNSYSEYGGWTTLAGHTIIEARNKKLPLVFDMSF